MNLYTPPGGLTPQAQSTQTFYNALQGITGMTPSAMSQSDLQSGQNQAMAQSLSLGANQGQAMQNAKTQLSQQAGVPALQNQFGDLSGAFQMWLADQNLAQKYSSGQNTNPWDNAGLVAAGNGNPYMAPAEQIINSTQTQNSGFTSPSLTTTAMGAPMYATTNFLNLLNSAITGQTNLVNTNLNTYSNNYAGAMDALGKVADMFGNERNRQLTANQNAATTPGTVQNAGSVFNGIIDQLHTQLGNAVTEYDIWKYLNEHQGALEAQGVNMNELWKLHKQLADKVGTGGVISGGKATTQQQKDQATQEADITAIRGFGDLMDSYMNGSYNLGPVRVINPTSDFAGKVEAQKKVYTGKLQQALGVGRGKYLNDSLMQSIPGEVAFSDKAQGQLQGHLSELLNAGNLVIYGNKKTDKMGIKPRNQLQQGDEILDTKNIPVQTLIQLTRDL